MAIDKAKIISLKKDLTTVLQAYAKSNGLSVSDFGISYNAEGFTVKNLTFADTAVVADGICPKAALHLKRYQLAYFGKEVYGLEVSFGGDTLRIDGMKGKKIVVTKLKCGGINTRMIVGQRYVYPIESMVKIVRLAAV